MDAAEGWTVQETAVPRALRASGAALEPLPWALEPLALLTTGSCLSESRLDRVCPGGVSCLRLSPVLSPGVSCLLSPISRGFGTGGALPLLAQHPAPVQRGILDASIPFRLRFKNI